MPEMHFHVRWPDGARVRYYSPSLVVREYLEVGKSYAMADFLVRSRTLFHIGAERVRAKFGFYCTAAMEELRKIEAQAARVPPDAEVTVEAFELPEAAKEGAG